MFLFLPFFWMIKVETDAGSTMLYGNIIATEVVDQHHLNRLLIATVVPLCGVTVQL